MAFCGSSINDRNRKFGLFAYSVLISHELRACVLLNRLSLYLTMITHRLLLDHSPRKNARSRAPSLWKPRAETLEATESDGSGATEPLPILRPDFSLPRLHPTPHLARICGRTGSKILDSAWISFTLALRVIYYSILTK